MLAECEMWSIYVMDANLSVSWIIRVLRTDANSVVESVASSILTLFYFRLFVLTALLPPPLVITNMFPIVTLTSFETMSEPRSARSAGSCFSPNSNNTIIVSLSLARSLVLLGTWGQQRSAASGPGLAPNMADESVDAIEPISQAATRLTM